jgi:hypothetical protein
VRSGKTSALGALLRIHLAPTSMVDAKVLLLPVRNARKNHAESVEWRSNYALDLDHSRDRRDSMRLTHENNLRGRKRSHPRPRSWVTPDIHENVPWSFRLLVHA